MSDELYRQTQNRIYGMQQTLLNSSKESQQNSGGDEETIEKHADSTMMEKKDDTLATEIENENENETEVHTENGHNEELDVSSRSVLEYTEKNYARQRRRLGMLQYDSLRVGAFPGDPRMEESLPFPYNFRTVQSPRPFIPRLSNKHINAILTIQIDSIYLQQVQRGENIRYQNRELWGTDIYTDDSDIILALQHCKVLPAEGFSTTPKRVGNNVKGRSTDSIKLKRTPGNLTNPDSVSGMIPEHDIPFALKVDILLLPPLQSYASSTRNDITSREWKGQIQDGLSFGIYNVEIDVLDDTLNDIEQTAKTQELLW